MILLFVTIPTHSMVAFDKLEGLVFQNGCSIYRHLGTVRTLPGRNCILLADGSFLSASETNLRRIGSTGNVLWEVGGRFHHQFNVTSAQDFILLLDSEIREGVRSDVLVKMSIDGKTIARVPAEKLMAQVGLKEGVPTPFTLPSGQVIHEATHFNGIIEISQTPEQRPPYLQKKNVMANAAGLGFFILTPDLSKVLHYQRFLTSNNHSVHDLQLTHRGDYLFFNNDVSRNGAKRSGFEIISSRNGKTLLLRYAPSDYFYSPFMGSVQMLDDELFLMGHAYNGAYLVNPVKGKILKTFPGTYGDGKVFLPTFEVRLIRNSERLPMGGYISD
jgi:hypothetical protein